MKPVRVAVIGAGEMANKVHYPSLSSLPEAEVVALCDLDEGRAAETAERWNIEKTYSDYRKMIEECAPDAVYAIGWPQIMRPIWSQCLDMGLDLFVEKPLGLTYAEASELAEAAESNGCITQVGFQRRTAPMVSMLHDRVTDRAPVDFAVCRFYKNDLSEFFGPYGRMLDDGVHAIDTLRWMCGGDVVSIQQVTKEIGIPDVNFAALLLQFSTGATGFMALDYATGRRNFSVEMHAPGITVEAEHEGVGTVYEDGDTLGESFDAREVAGSDELYVYGGFQAKSKEFLDAVRTRKQPGSAFADAAKTMEVADRVLRVANEQS